MRDDIECVLVTIAGVAIGWAIIAFVAIPHFH